MRLSPPISVLSLIAATFLAMAGNAGLRGVHVSHQPEILEVDLSTWGNLEVRWTMDRNGRGEVWRAERESSRSEKDSKSRQRKIEKFRIALKKDDMHYFFEQADELKIIASKSPRCENVTSDMGMGSAVWRSPNFYQEYKYNYGCNSVQADRAITYIGVTTSIVLSYLKDNSKPYAVTFVPLN